MSKILWLVYASAAAFHLCTILAEKRIMRSVSKALLIPLLAAAYVAFADHVIPMILLALLFGWAGDCLLLNGKNHVFFGMGLGSFLVGHVCYIIAVIRRIGAVDIPILAVSIVLVAIVGAAVFRATKPPAALRVPIILYELTLITFIVACFQFFMYAPGVPQAFVLFGCAFFIVSDSKLGYLSFRHQTRYGNFWVMVTYALAQACIVRGFGMLV